MRMWKETKKERAIKRTTILGRWGGVKIHMCKDGAPQGTQGIHGHGKPEEMVAAEPHKPSHQIRNNNTSN